MARINSYTRDKNISEDDILVGSSFEGNGQTGPIYKTQSYRIKDLADYLNLVFTVDEVNYNLNIVVSSVSTNASAIASANQRIDVVASDVLAQATFQTNLSATFGTFNDQGVLQSLSQSFADQVLQTTSSERYANAVFVTNLASSVGTFDANGNLLTIAEGFANSVMTTTSSDRFAESQFVDNLGASFGTVGPDGTITTFSAEYLNTITAYADSELAITSSIQTLTADVGANAAAIVTESTARTTADEALSTQITTLSATVDANTAAITTEATTRATEDTALSNTITSLTATVNSNTAAISAESTARADADTALTNSITTLSATVDANTAAISTESTARADGDTALTNSITTLTATVDGNTAAVQTNATAIADVDGKLTASYGITVDAQGRVAGLKLLADGTTGSEFIAKADTFAVDMPNGNRVLTVDSSGLFINGSGTFSGALSGASGTFGHLSTENSAVSINYDTSVVTDSSNYAGTQKIFNGIEGDWNGEQEAWLGTTFLNVPEAGDYSGIKWQGGYSTSTFSHLRSLIYVKENQLNIEHVGKIPNANPMVIKTFAQDIWINAGSNDVDVTGNLTKTSGSFRIPHPLPEKSETHDLVHSFVESPQANNIYRGKVNLVNGEALIDLDEESGMTIGTFRALNKDLHVYVSNESNWDSVRGFIEENKLKIQCKNENSNALVNWLVIGTRKDDAIKSTNLTDDNGDVVVEPLKKIRKN